SEKRIENFVHHLRGNAGASIGNLHFHHSLILPEARAGTIARFPFYFLGLDGPQGGGNREDTAFAHRVAGVGEQIDEDLFDPARVEEAEWHLSRVTLHHGDFVVLEFVTHQAQRSLDDDLQIAWPKIEFPRRRIIEKPANDRGRPRYRFAHFFVHDLRG